jgi:hypothetical protein
MSQPAWKLVAQLGDADPISYGGYFVYEDATGVHPPEAELLESPDDDDAPEGWTVYRFPLERCTFIDGVLSDNSYHPECPAWFADDLNSVASCMGLDVQALRDDLCSADPIRLAEAYRAIGEYHGFINMDEYPISDFDRSQLEARYADHSPV